MSFNVLSLKSSAIIGVQNFGIALSFALVAMSGQSRADDSVRIPTNLCFWTVMAWHDFNSAERAAWSGLGWTKQVWDDSEETDYPASYQKTWSELAGKDKIFAAKLGFSSKTWGVEGCPNYSTLALKKKVEPAPVPRKTVVSTSLRGTTSLLPPVHKNAGVLILGGMDSFTE